MTLRTSVLTVVVAAAACTKPPEVVPPPPPGVVNSFTATPKTITTPGQMVTLAWDTKDAQRVALEQVGKGPITIDSTAATGTVQVAVTAGATFLLTATGEGGTDTALQSVALEGVTGGALFEAVPRQVAPGEKVTLVWNVPGAPSVTITPAGSAALDLRGQKAIGSVIVTPTTSTRYTLTAGSVTATVDVEVSPVIVSFEASPSPAPGQPVTLSWQTVGGSKLTLTRAGAGTPLVSETMDAARIARGSFSETAPAGPADGVMTYRLEVEQGALKAERIVIVRLGNDLRLNTFTVPQYVRDGFPYGISWTTQGATSVELQVDGASAFVAPSAATVAAGSAVLPPLVNGTAVVRILVRNNRGGLITAVRTVSPVGPPALTSFSASTGSITNGGEPVVLSWDVTNARVVRITELGGGLVHSATGTLDNGSVTVYPNRASTVYTLSASNGAGESITPQSATVTVTNVARLTFERLLPTGATGRVTGHSVIGGAEVWGLPTAEERPGEAFVDIAGSGTSISYLGPDTQAKQVTLPETFSTVIYGRRVSSSSLSISINGWFMFGGSAVAGPDNNSALPGTALEPLAIAPYWDDLYDIGPSEIYYRLDDVAGQRRLIVQWQEVEHDDYPGSVLTFQAQVYASGKIVFAYQRLDGVTTIDPTVGVVSSTELDAVVAPSAPAAGKTFTFFGSPAVLPLPLRLESLPYNARVGVGAGFVELEGDGRIPPGQFSISEVNPRPAAGLTNAEWLEVTNSSAQPIDLQGWTINLGGMNTHVIGMPVVLPPNGRVLLAQSSNLGDPTAMLTADYVYPATLAMPDASGTVTLDLAGVAFARIAWDSTSVPSAGVSARGVTAPTVGNVLGATSCSSTGTGTYGVQTGTPGTAAAPCIPYAMSRLAAPRFESIADGGTLMSSGSADEDVYTVTLPTPIRYYGTNVTTLYVSTNGWITTTSTTNSALTNKTTPSTTAPVGSIAPFWDDLEVGLTPHSGMFWRQFDPDAMPMSGDEYTIVSWEGWQVFTWDGEDLNFQVKFKANGDIEYHFADLVALSPRGQGSQATSWFEDRGGRTAFALSVDSASPGILPFTSYLLTYSP